MTVAVDVGTFDVGAGLAHINHHVGHKSAGAITGLEAHLRAAVDGDIDVVVTVEVDR